MTRDTDRRRLRDIYDRNRRRVDTVAKRRDRTDNSRRGGNDDRRGGKNSNNNNNNNNNGGASPRRYIVSERVTRRAGFGEGGRQANVNRGRADGSRRQERFADKKVTRRSHRDRFERAERNASRRDGGNNGNGRRGGSRRDSVVESRRSRRNTDVKRGGDNKNNNKQQKGGRFNRRAEKRDERKNNKKSNNNNDKKKGGNNNNKPRSNKPLSGDDLNAQLEAYKNNEVFNPSAFAAQQQQQARSANTLQSLDAQLDAFRA